MDNFAEQAFRDAERAAADKEEEAWMRFVEEKGDFFNYAVAERVGLADMNELARVINKAGRTETFAQYAHELMIGMFHIGYHARMEEECRDR